MAPAMAASLSFLLLLFLLFVPHLTFAQQACFEECDNTTLICSRPLACINGICRDPPLGKPLCPRIRQPPPPPIDPPPPPPVNPPPEPPPPIDSPPPPSIDPPPPPPIDPPPPPPPPPPIDPPPPPPVDPPPPPLDPPPPSPIEPPPPSPIDPPPPRDPPPPLDPPPPPPFDPPPPPPTDPPPPPNNPPPPPPVDPPPSPPINPPPPPPVVPPPPPPPLPAPCFPFGGTECGFRYYPLYRCSPGITTNFIPAILTFNPMVGPGSIFAWPAKCDGIKHSEWELVVSLSTGWFSNGNHCGKKILIKSNFGISVVAKVVSECDSQSGCRPHFQPPCGNDIIEATRAVFNALKYPFLGSVQVYWSFIA